MFPARVGTEEHGVSVCPTRLDITKGSNVLSFVAGL